MLRDLGVFLVALTLGLASTYAIERSELGEVAPRGVVLGSGQSVAGMSGPEVSQLLQPEASRLLESKVTLKLGDEEATVELKRLGVRLDTEGVAREAVESGSSGGELKRLFTWLRGLHSQTVVDLTFEVDGEKLRAWGDEWAKKRLVTPIAPTLHYESSLKAEPGRAGETIDYAELARSLSSDGGVRSETLPVPIKRQPLLVPKEVFEREKLRAQRLIQSPIRLKKQDGTFSTTLTPKQLGSALKVNDEKSAGGFRVELDEKKLYASLKESLAEIERAAIDATFEFSSKGAPKIIPSEEGVRVNRELLVRDLFRASEEKKRVVELSLNVEKPKLSEAEAASLGVKGLVSTFSTRHACCQSRVKNIHHAAAKIHGTVLRPGERFSLNEVLGQRSRAAGYHKAPTIVRGQMKDVYGGGISQLATTLFNAVLRGGYEIVQRQPHSIYFSRYPEGHEATVSFPEPDLIFANDTGSGMVIVANYTPTVINISVYGDNEGRVTSVKKSKRYKVVQPPVEYEANDEMDPEESKRLRAGQLGWTVLVTRIVKLADGTTREEKREVVYQPRPQLVRVHSCVIPKGEEGHTGEDCPEPEREEREEELSEDVYYETSVDQEE